MINKKGTALALCLLLTGCAGKAVQTPLVCAEAPTPGKVELAPLSWTLVQHEGRVLMALDGVGIDTLQLNLLTLRRYIAQSKLEVEYYQGCIEKHQETR